MKTVRTDLKGLRLLNTPRLNRGSAFDQAQRRQFALEGLLPSRVGSMPEQLKRDYQAICRKTDPLEQYIGLISLQNRNETLFYRLLLEHLEQFLPIVYTPTVGQACQLFSHIFRNLRGLWITPEHRGRIAQIFDNWPERNVRLIVVTDNERILGLGDQGAGGMGIPVGKLSLYTVAAGIHPSLTLPISLDVGTDNEALLNDPLYLGWPHKRLRGAAYEALIEEFVQAVQQRFPQALLQWEDFKQQNALDLLDRYRRRILSFNDDIQGTAAIAVAGILAACRATGQTMAQQRIFILGAGAAGIGIGRMLKSQQPELVAMADSQGLLVEGRQWRENSKAEFALGIAAAKKMGIDPNRPGDLVALMHAIQPTVLIGASGIANAFSEAMIRAMAQHTERPIILPFSNPNSACEAHPADCLNWTSGRALVATGSPFGPVSWNGKNVPIGQGNNAYIFPGVGLGALVAQASEITDSMFGVAAAEVAASVKNESLAAGALYPPLAELREISARIAKAVVREARDRGVGRQLSDVQIDHEVDAFMWYPDYPVLEGV